MGGVTATTADGAWQEDKDCLRFATSERYADVCSNGTLVTTCMPKVPAKVCCDWCEAQLQRMCGAPSDDTQRTLHIKYCSDTMACENGQSASGASCYNRIPSAQQPTAGTSIALQPVATPSPPAEAAGPPAPEGILSITLRGIDRADFTSYLQVRLVLVRYLDVCHPSHELMY
jgi:hypothetical protein